MIFKLQTVNFCPLLMNIVKLRKSIVIQIQSLIDSPPANAHAPTYHILPLPIIRYDSLTVTTIQIQQQGVPPSIPVK